MFKKKNKEARASGEKKGIAWKLLGSFFVAAALFGVLIGVEKNILSDYAKETAVLCKTDVPKGTKITEANADQYFYSYEVDAAMINGNCIKDKKELFDTVVTRNLSVHEIVREGACMKEAEIYGRYRNPVEASVEAKEAGDIVSGTIRKGDHVDIAVVNKDTLEYDVMLKDVYVLGAYTSTGEAVVDGMEGTAATMLTIVEDKDNLSSYYSAREVGNVIITKVDPEK